MDSANDKLEEWLNHRVQENECMKYLTLGELKDLRELVQHAIIESLCEYSPVVFEPIFSDEIEEK